MVDKKIDSKIESKEKEIPVWVTRTEKKQVISFKTRNTVFVKFLDNGVEEKGGKDIDLKDGTKKKIHPVTFNVFDLDTKIEKVWDVSSARLLTELLDFYPLTGKSFQITGIGTSYDRYYEVRPFIKP